MLIKAGLLQTALEQTTSVNIKKNQSIIWISYLLNVFGKQMSLA